MTLPRLLFTFFIIAFLSVNAHAQWNELLSSATSGYPAAAATESGAVVAWLDDGELLARCYSELGSVRWTSTVAASGGTSPQIVGQGSDCFVAWLQSTGHVLKIAKLSSTGAITATATLDSTVLSGAEGLVMAARSGGGVTVGWLVSNVGYARLYAANLDGSSHVAAKFNDGGNVDLLRLVNDSSDGVIAVWAYGTYPYAVHGTRVSSTGTKLWSNAVTLIERPGFPASSIEAVLDQTGGAVVAAAMSNTIYAQHVDEDGNTYWDGSTYGEPVCEGGCFLSDNAQIVLNSSGTAAVVSWREADFTGSSMSLKAQKLPLAGSWNPEWTFAGVVVAPLDANPWSYRMVAGSDDRTKFVRSVFNDNTNVGTVDYRVIDNSGNVVFTPAVTVYTQQPVYYLEDTSVLSPLVDHSLGVFIPFRLYENSTDAARLSSVSWPISNIEFSWDPVHCRNNVAWNTVAGSSLNKLQYRHPNGSWSTKNASGSGGSYTANYSLEGTSNYRILTTVGGVAYTSGIYQGYGVCDEPEPEGAPMTEQRVSEAYMTAHPIPFNPQVTIDYGLPTAADITLTIFDVSGRQVRALDAGLKRAGQHSATWQGEDDRGEPVSSGVYFGRLTVNGKTLTRKLVMMK